MPVACKRLKLGGRLIITLVAALFLMGCLSTTECKEEVSSNISNEEIEEIMNSVQASLVEMDYVLNTSTKKFHYPSCRSVKQMKEKNTVYFTGTRDEEGNMRRDRNDFVPEFMFDKVLSVVYNSEKHVKETGICNI